MPRSSSVGSRTIDGVSMLRCMVVALTTAQEAACRAAIAPVEVVRAADVAAACSSMSTVLPLVVVVDEEMAAADRAALTEFTTACGAEIVGMGDEASDVFAARLLVAIGVAERRRLGMRI